MALKFDHDNDEINAEINVTPLIDIMLVLLILFMVTSSVSLESGLDVDLPQASTTQNSERPSAVIISLAADGRISVQGRIVQTQDLQKAIEEELTAGQTQLVILEGDKAADLGSAVNVMDIARAAGAKQFAIAADSANAQ